MATAVYTGSFDPITNGHIDVIKRGAKLFDKLVVGVLNNSVKIPLFSLEERVNIIREVVSDLDNVEVCSFDGLAVDFAVKHGAQVFLRGLRAVTDFEYELQMAQTNRILNPTIDTLFLATSLEYAYLSSTIVKEVAAYGGDISQFVPDFVAQKIIDKLIKKN
jgi:pantetheine-phosphate adenylyltransferase